MGFLQNAIQGVGNTLAKITGVDKVKAILDNVVTDSQVQTGASVVGNVTKSFLTLAGSTDAGAIQTSQNLSSIKPASVNGIISDLIVNSPRIVKATNDVLSPSQVIAATQTPAPQSPSYSPGFNGGPVLQPPQSNSNPMNLGDITSIISSVIKQPTISNVLGLVTNQTNSSVPSNSAAGIAAPASVQGSNVSVEQQTTGSGIFSGIGGFTGGGSLLQKKASVLPTIASSIAAQGGSETVPLGGGISISLPTNNQSPATQPTASSSTPVWLWPVVIVVVIILGLVALLNFGKK